jgi:MoaA/NifB/PqqE/SkfB family radical SAM enzyme
MLLLVNRRAIRFVPLVVPYLTPWKILNYLKFKNDLRRLSITTSSFPPGITFQASSYCNSTCRLCPVGLGIYGPKKGFLQFDVFKKVVEETKKYLVTIDFADWGEPFLNPNIFRMIKFAESQRIVTHASTNLHCFRNEKDLEKLLNCGLSLLIVSMHGATQKTYEAYQPGKSFDLTYEKLRTLVRLKKSRNSRKPEMTLAFAINRKNEHEIEKMQMLSDSLGLESLVYTASLNLRFHLEDSTSLRVLIEEWSQRRGFERCNNSLFNKERIQDLYSIVQNEFPVSLDKLDRACLTSKYYCTDPWQSLVVNWDGTVSLCCTDYNKYQIGDVRNQSILNIWNCQKYIEVRKFLLGKKCDENLNFYCRSCLRY